MTWDGCPGPGAHSSSWRLEDEVWKKGLRHSPGPCFDPQLGTKTGGCRAALRAELNPDHAQQALLHELPPRTLGIDGANPFTPYEHIYVYSSFMWVMYAVCRYILYTH